MSAAARLAVLLIGLIFVSMARGAEGSHDMQHMTYDDMATMMGMDDTATFAGVTLDELEARFANSDDARAWDLQAFYGNDYDKLLLKTEGEHAGGAIEHGDAELLWDRIWSRWWSVQAGARHDFGEGPSRDWLALGVQGLAPWFLELEATAYLGESGRSAARFKGEYDLRFTQRLILQPKFELNVYGKDDPRTGHMSGLSDVEIGLRLRYELRREVAPYLGVVWLRQLGQTADLARSRGDNASDVQMIAGVRVRF